MNPIVKVGDINTYKILKLAKAPDGEEMFILEDQLGKMTTLSAKYYLHYDLKIGEQINCRIDKINCAGMIFYEPEHPYYKIGENYFFKFLGFASRTRKKSCETISVIIVEDIYKNECTLLSEALKNKTDPIPEFLKCKVIRIKKAKLFLEFAD